MAEILSRMMDKFSLEGLKDSEIFDLSEGEKQKVALASVVSLSKESRLFSNQLPLSFPWGKW
ncbi:MAG: hypothetical protein U9N19_10625 [Thermodesulfobacteriota bacterium]|nr:hypothetical protein [Thermodesulfobacteriota bacterium]